MGIYVKDMKMPKNCYECPFSHNNPIGAGMFLRCKSPKMIRDWDDCQKGRHPNCPLKDISEDEIKRVRNTYSGDSDAWEAFAEQVT